MDTDDPFFFHFDRTFSSSRPQHRAAASSSTGSENINVDHIFGDSFFRGFQSPFMRASTFGGVPASPFGAFHTAGPSSSFPSSSSNGNGYAPSNPQPQPSPPPPPPPRHTIQRVDLSCSLEELFRGVRKVYMWVYARIKRYVCAKGREWMNRGTPSCVSAKLRCWTTFLAYPSLSLNTRKLSLSAPSYSP